MKTVTFELKLTFTEDISNSEIEEVRDNIRRALEAELESGIGISPEDGDALTKSIEIRSSEVNNTFIFI